MQAQRPFMKKLLGGAHRQSALLEIQSAKNLSHKIPERLLGACELENPGFLFKTGVVPKRPATQITQKGEIPRRSIPPPVRELR